MSRDRHVERYRSALLCEREQLTYQIGVWQGFIDKRSIRIREIDEELAKTEVAK